MTTFHLIRHGAHDLLGRVLTGRMPGVALNEAGRAQAAGLAAALAGGGIAAVVSSPLQRARETAAPIAARLGLPDGASPLTQLLVGTPAPRPGALAAHLTEGNPHG